jgi:nucleotide-binding universal stress UspA family protein
VDCDGLPFTGGLSFAWRGFDGRSVAQLAPRPSRAPFAVHLDARDADLIVAVAFGHSRMYEGLFGGVTIDLMHQQSLPALMSH